MKVLCIKTGQWVGALDKRTYPGPKYGEEVTVTGQWINYGTPVYGIVEYPHAGGFWIKHFIPLSDIDETTFERNYQKELV